MNGYVHIHPVHHPYPHPQTRSNIHHPLHIRIKISLIIK